MFRNPNPVTSLDFEYDQEFFKTVNEMEQELRDQRMEPQRYEMRMKTPTYHPQALENEIRDRDVQVRILGLASPRKLDEEFGLEEPYEIYHTLMQKATQVNQGKGSALDNMNMFVPGEEDSHQVKAAGMKVRNTDFINVDTQNLEPYVDALQYFVDEEQGGSVSGLSFYSLNSGRGTTLAEAVDEFSSGTEVGIGRKNGDELYISEIEDGVASFEPIE